MRLLAPLLTTCTSRRSRIPALLVVWLAVSPAFQPVCAAAAEPAQAASGRDQSLGDAYRYIGQIRPRHARDIAASNWSIGAETMDRDYTIYARWRQFLGPLGAKKARIQSGWAKTEKQRGVYDWAWVDEIVLDMVDQGVEPWVCLCYGNPIYPGGGGTGLGGGLVASEEALQAWQRYVATFVDRYAKYVDEWELWNEPRTGRGEGAAEYARFVVRTAEIIRRRQPDAEIMFAAGGSFDTTFAQQVLAYLREQDQLALVNTIIYHPYAYNPDDRYGAVEELRKMAQSFSPHIGIRQGENGAPSRPGSFGAISKNDWTERSQAKWAVRRLLGDLGRDIPSSYFKQLAVYDSAVVIAERGEIERVLAPVAAPQTEDASCGPVLESPVAIDNRVPLAGAALAVEDLASDLEKVLGAAPRMVDGEDADIIICLDDARHNTGRSSETVRTARCMTHRED